MKSINNNKNNLSKKSSKKERLYRSNFDLKTNDSVISVSDKKIPDDKLLVKDEYVTDFETNFKRGEIRKLIGEINQKKKTVIVGMSIILENSDEDRANVLTCPIFPMSCTDKALLYIGKLFYGGRFVDFGAQVEKIYFAKKTKFYNEFKNCKGRLMPYLREDKVKEIADGYFEILKTSLEID